MNSIMQFEATNSAPQPVGKDLADLLQDQVVGAPTAAGQTL